MLIRTLIVEDDSRARQRIRSLLANESDFSIVAECSTHAEAVNVICAEAPAVVFLKIPAPENEGKAWVASLPEVNRPLLVFMTADRQYALDAYDLGAIDCLLNPFKTERFQQALTRVRDRLRERSGTTRRSELAPPAYVKRLIVRLTEHQLVVPTVDVDWMESASNYIVLHTGGVTHVLRDTLSSLEKRLSPVQFLRVGRFAIVNLDRVRKLKATEAGDHIVVMADGAEVPITCGIREVQARLEFS